MKTRESEDVDASPEMEAVLRDLARWLEQLESDPRIPRLDPGMRPAEARRLAARLRSGAFRPRDLRIPPEDLAALCDAAALKERFVSETFELIRQCWLWSAVAEAQNLRRNFVAGFHRLKKVAKAMDPDSGTVRLLRCLHRLRRKETGRSRRR